MMVLIMQKVPLQLRGYVSRFLIEVKSGIFIGKCSIRVRESLWKSILENSEISSSSIMIWSDNTKEQGFDFIAVGSIHECNIDGFISVAKKDNLDKENNERKCIHKKGWSKAYRYRHFT